jgi:hypothetical protein
VLLIALLTIGTNTFTDAIARVSIGIERRPEETAAVNEPFPAAGRSDLHEKYIEEVLP